MVGFRYNALTTIGQNTHQLLVRLEWLTKLEVDICLETPLDIRDHGRVVVTIVPWPRCYTTVVVVENPLQTLDVVLRQLAELFLVATVPIKLALVVAVLPSFELFVVLLLHLGLSSLGRNVDNLGLLIFLHNTCNSFGRFVFHFLILVRIALDQLRRGSDL
ncbi:hypothetical protein COCCADRAFT_96246 [Bipolaris zeicola 26-R-13]|uniref:Uncharacterized protein n=1 Tax=Cochliobolus carbonum (strain 26-R-13) TaxID=930089 RepID=W6Y0X0_COCC2|nr:uncharacterized protein COCCADRAFT_96246 [Bipolaris zeicola 26-R-13]EUC33377.1 hypothetical protein COCCADRAFT_96246 [Bipolaris zeicola 26-R-13]